MMTLTLLVSFTIGMSASLSKSSVWVGLMLLTMMLFYMMALSLAISQWMAMIVFIIYIGGMMIMFAYFLSMETNIKYTMSGWISSQMMAYTVMLSFLSMNPPMPILDLLPPMKTLMVMFNAPFMVILTMALFLILVTVVTITKTPFSPMRPFLN